MTLPKLLRQAKQAKIAKKRKKFTVSYIWIKYLHIKTPRVIHYSQIVKEWVSFFLGSWDMNRSAEQTNRVNREAVLVRFVCSKCSKFVWHKLSKNELKNFSRVQRRRYSTIVNIYCWRVLTLTYLSSTRSRSRRDSFVVHYNFNQSYTICIVLLFDYCRCFRMF